MLTATLLGRPRLTRAGVAIPWSTPPKTVTLLAYLVLADQTPVERDEAACALWPDVPDTQARANLRRHIFYLERQLPPLEGADWLQRTGSRIALNPAQPFQSDVTDFQRLSGPDASEADLERAQQLYTGELLEGYDEEWIVPERRRLYERYLDVLERLLGRATDRGDLAGAAAYANRLLQLEPWREQYARALMRLRYQLGDRCGALDLYHAFAEKLQGTYNISPSPETIRLKDLIEENGSVHEAAGNLPAALTTFIGREAELEELANRLKRARLLTITGIGGVGKTRLALRLAEIASYRFDEIWYVDFARSTGLDDTLQSHLRSAQALVIADGCETATAKQRAQVKDLLTACRGVRVLAAGRSPLRIDGEALWRVDPLTPDDAQALFVERARSASKSFSFTRQNSELVRRLCADLEGLPLALELAAAHLESSSFEQLLRQHADRRPQGPITAALAWSYDSLTDGARALYRGIAVFAGSWTLDAAETICLQDRNSHSQTLELLAELTDKSLVTSDLSTEPVRYRCLDLVREHALSMQEEHAELAGARLRHARYYAALALQLETGSDHASWTDALARFGAEQPNFDAALRYLLAERNDVQRGVDMALALWRFWRESGHWSTGREWLQQAYEATQDDPLRNVRALHRLASLARIAADYGEARTLYERALEIAKTLEDRRTYGDALFAAAFSAMKQGDLDRAQTLGEEALTVQLQARNEAGAAHARNTLGSIALNRERSADARRFFEEALAFFETANDERNAAIIVGNLGLCSLYEGDLDGARGAFTEGIAGSRNAGNRQFVGYMLVQVADAQLLADDRGGIGAHLSEALAIAQEAGDKETLIRVLETTAVVSGLEGRRASSRCLLGAAARARAEFHLPLQQPEQRIHERKLALLGRAVTAPRTIGAMPMKDALAIARSEIETLGAATPGAPQSR